MFTERQIAQAILNGNPQHHDVKGTERRQIVDNHYRIDIASRLQAITQWSNWPAQAAGERGPLPMSLFFRVTSTTADEANIASMTTAMPRCPGVVRMLAARGLRKDHTVDVTYGTSRKRSTILAALVDRLMDDDLSSLDGMAPLSLPACPVGWAWREAAAQVEASCRFWHTKGATPLIRSQQRESDAWQQASGIDWRRVLSEWSQIVTPDEAIELIESIEDQDAWK